MKAVFFLLFSLLISSISFAEPKIVDPKGLLQEVDQFLSGNFSPECGGISEYDWAKCQTKCDKNGCQMDNCPLQNNESVVGGISKFKTVNCNEKTIGIMFKPRIPTMGHQTWFERTQFANTQTSIQAAMGAFLPWTIGGRCPFFGKRGIGKLDFWTSELMIEKVEPEEVKMKTGPAIAALKISGSINLPIRNIQPGCRDTMVQAKFDLWMGRGVSYAEQFLRFDYDNKTIFKITDSSRR